MNREKITWRDPALGERHALDLAQGRLRWFDAGSGPAIVFVHGLLVNANLWRKVVARLSPDFRCVTLDLPLGAHELPMKPDADLSPLGVANLIADAIEALELEEVTLVGNDTGGALCQLLVTSRPERIGRLVLTSCDYRDKFPPPTLDLSFRLLPALEPLLPVLFAPTRVRAFRRLPLFMGGVTKRPIEPRAEDSFVLPILSDRRVRADFIKMVRGVDRRLTNQAADRLKDFDRPALIAWSREDRFFTTEDGEGLASDLPNARLEWIDDARTFSAEDQPDRLAELIAGFVRENAGTVASPGISPPRGFAESGGRSRS